MKKLCIILLAAALSASACHKGEARQAAPAPSPAADSLAQAAELPLPDVPQTLRTPSERAAYIIGHFWDAMDFGDTARSRDRAFIEQNFANFLSVFPYADAAAQRQAVDLLLHRAEADSAAYALLADMAEKYLYETDSPMQSEDIYLLFLDGLTQSPVLGPEGTVRLRWQLEAARKNRPGTTAADFAYTARDGRRSTLGRTWTESDSLLLIFYDPDCDHCQETMAALRQDEALRRLTDGGRLAVLAVCSGGERALWQDDAVGLPAAWTVGYEPGTLQEEGLYVLRTLPTLYLLGRGRRVIHKEIRPEDLLRQFRDAQGAE